MTGTGDARTGPAGTSGTSTQEPSTGPVRAGRDRQRRLTLMSVDLVGSTQLAEHLDPERLRDVLLSYHDVCDQSVRRYDGRIGARPGDGMMVHFGLTNPHEDDARRATLAGLAIIEALAPLARRLRETDGVDLQVRVGVHTGPVVITEFGGREEIVGTTPNETARIESQATPGTVAVSDATYELIADDFTFADTRAVTLRGVSTPMRIHTVRGVAARRSRSRAVIPFVGRHGPRRQLLDAWGRARTARPSDGAAPTAALIVGPAGYGKSRLAELVASAAVRDGARRLDLEARAYDAGTPYGPVVRAIGESFRAERTASGDDRYAALEAGLAALGVGHLAPVLSQLVDLGAERLGDAAATEPVLLQAALRDAVVGWFGALAAAGPAVLLVEDLHWADPSTVGAIAQLVHDAVPGLLLLMTARPGFVAPWDPAAVETVELGALTEDDVARLMGLLGADSPLTEETVARVVDASDGVPLYLDRLIDLARREGTGRDGVIPNGVDQLLTTVIEAPGVDPAFVGLLASIDRRFPADLVADVAGIDEPTAVGRLEALCELGILTPVSDADVPAYAFHHALLQVAAYEHQLPSDRRAAHARIAAAIERRGAASAFDVATMGRHLDEAGRPLEAVPYLLAASLAAMRKGANTEALRHIDRGIELLGSVESGPARDALEIDLQMRRSLCLTASEGFSSVGALEAARRAFSLTSGVDRRVYRRAITALYSFHTVRGERDAAGAIIRDARSRADSPPDHVACDQIEALHLLALGRLRESSALYLSSIDALEEHERARGGTSRDPSVLDTLTASYVQMAQLSWQFGDASASQDWYDRALKRARSFDGAKAAFSEAYVASWGCYLRLQAGDDQGALERSTAQREFCARKGLAMYGAIASIRESIAAGRLAPTPQVADQLGMLIDGLEAMGVQSMVTSHVAQRGVVLHRLGRHTAALDAMDRSVEIAHRNQELQELSETYRLRAHVHRSLGDDVEAERDLQSAAALAIEQGATVFGIRALVDLLVHFGPDCAASRDLGAPAALERLVASVATPDAYAEVATARDLLERLADGMS